MKCASAVAGNDGNRMEHWLANVNPLISHGWLFTQARPHL